MEVRFVLVKSYHILGSASTAASGLSGPSEARISENLRELR
jgi:hypothetical protein